MLSVFDFWNKLNVIRYLTDINFLIIEQKNVANLFLAFFVWNL